MSYKTFNTSISDWGSPIYDAEHIMCFGNSSSLIKSNGKVLLCGSNYNKTISNTGDISVQYLTESDYSGKVKVSTYIKNLEINDDSMPGDRSLVVNIPSSSRVYLSGNNNLGITISDYTSSSSSFFKNYADKDIVMMMEPANSFFTDYLEFTVNVTSKTGLTVMMKSNTSVTPIQLTENDTTNDAYYTVDPSANKITIKTKHFTEFGIGTGTFCLLKGTKVLTPEGYKLIENLKCNDMIITDTNREVPIVNIFKTVINPELKPNFIPYKIERNSISENYPAEDTYMSGYHMIKFGDNWIEPKKCPKFNKDLSIKEIVYYHIQLENFETDNLVINGGLIVESLGNGSEYDGKIWCEREKNSLIIE